METSKSFTFKTRRDQIEVYVERQTYDRGGLRIQLTDADGNPFAVASVAVSGVELEPDEIIVKDYSENEGMLDFLVDNNIVELTDLSVIVGHNMCKIAKVLPESDWAPVEYNQHFNINGMSIYAKDYYQAIDLYQLACDAEQQASW